MLKIANIILYPVTLFFLALLLLSYLAPSVSPNTMTLFAFLGLSYPFLLIVNVLTMIYWAAQLKVRALYPLFAVLVGWSNVNAIFQVSGRSLPSYEKGIKVASFNTQLFGLYQERQFSDSVMRYAAMQQYDVFCMQEFYVSSAKESKTLENFKTRLKLPYSWFLKLNNNNEKGKNYGSVILSRYPIIDKGNIDLGKTANLCAWVDLLINLDTIRVYNVHLQSIRFKKKDYNFIKNPSADTTSKLEAGKGLLRRINSAFKTRALQADLIQNAIKECKHPVIVCGDFNDPPLSYTYGCFSSFLSDAFIESGSGFEKTYQGPFPSFRIDYILYSKKFEGYNYKSTNKLPSDHKLVEAVIKIKP